MVNEAILTAFINSCSYPVIIKLIERNALFVNDSYRQSFVGKNIDIPFKDGTNIADIDSIANLKEIITDKDLALEQDSWVDGVLYRIGKYPLHFQGRKVGIKYEIHDITYQHKTKKSLDEQRLILRSVVDAIPDIVFFKDASREYLGSNKAMERILGIKESDVLGKTDDELLEPSLAKTCYESDMAILTGEPKFSIEEVIKTPEGDFVYESVKTPIETQDGNIIGIVGISRDVTARKNKEDAIEQAKKAAEAANMAKTIFLTNMSHEIRTPLNAVMGIIYILMGTKVDEKQLDYLKKAYQSSQILLNIINDILDFAKIENGEMVLNNQEFILGDMLDKVCEVTRFKAEKKNLNFVAEIQPKLPKSVIGDEVRLLQILYNLTSNAVKFTDKGTVTFSVKKRSINSSRVELTFSIKDTGIGIKEEALNKLFTPFVQVDSSSTKKYGGTGLGLAICKQLAGLMNGEVQYNSRQGQGSEFIFVVTFDLPEDNSENTNKTNILAIEDNEINCIIMQDMLYENYNMDMCSTVEESIPYIKQNHYDVILLNIQVPEKRPEDIINAVKTAAKGVPVIALGDSNAPYDYESSIQAGADEHIEKPIDATTLYDKINRFVIH